MVANLNEMLDTGEYSWGATVAGSGGWKQNAPISWHSGNCRTTKKASKNT
jgi:hypothetical protein